MTDGIVNTGSGSVNVSNSAIGPGATVRNNPAPRIEFRRSGYGTYIVTVDGKRVYESPNMVKALGVTEYLEQIHATIAFR